MFVEDWSRTWVLCNPGDHSANCATTTAPIHSVFFVYPFLQCHETGKSSDKKVFWLLLQLLIFPFSSLGVSTVDHKQCDQTGLFLKDLSNKLSYKRSRSFWQLFGLFWKMKPLRLLFWSPFGEIWATFNYNIWSHWSTNFVGRFIHCF